jgi:protein ImuA
MSVRTPETLHALRRTVADVTTDLAASLPGEDGRFVSLGVASLDAALTGGLACGALHEIGPAAPLHGGAAAGFAMALMARALRRGGPKGGKKGSQAVWIQPDFTAAEAGALYGPGLDLLGLPMERLVILRVPRPRDALWAMEETLKCRAAGVVVVELASPEADLTATRRLALAAREGGGLGLILTPTEGMEGCCSHPSTATTRWEVASARGERDRFGGLGPTTFALSLVKNRRGRTGQWRLSWDHHGCAFATSLSLPVAPAARDGSPRNVLPPNAWPGNAWPGNEWPNAWQQDDELRAVRAG